MVEDTLFRPRSEVVDNTNFQETLQDQFDEHTGAITGVAKEKDNDTAHSKIDDPHPATRTKGGLAVSKTVEGGQHP